MASTGTDCWDIMGSVGLVQALPNLAWRSSCWQALPAPVVNSNICKALSEAQLVLVADPPAIFETEQNPPTTCCHLSIWVVKDEKSGFLLSTFPPCASLTQLSCFPQNYVLVYSAWRCQAGVAAGISFRSSTSSTKGLIKLCHRFPCFFVAQATEVNKKV